MKKFTQYLYKNFGYNLILLNIFLFLIRGIHYVPENFALILVGLSAGTSIFLFVYVTYTDDETIFVKFCRKFIEPQSLIGYFMFIIYVALCNNLLSDF
jgi:predicted secreted protein